MKNIILFMIVLMALCLSGCSQEAQNKLARKQIEMMEQDYTVTYTDNKVVLTWEVISGKVTTRGVYYFFWATVEGEKVYVQTPIARTIIQQRK